ncbi:MAG: cytochrome d ubiquinol oxidase subunit II [Armatimonadetes bacterium]|nr:cytochrome d ubiquinol oxidase subunit II [Armatimonadota bacterium]MDE2205021.1 cytochrome d ubiquinol oxidase subunit II [Armatimonadota bacterium]
MTAFWFGALSLMLAIYVVLDGFDIGAAILHLFVARSDPERRSVLQAIGPYWDGNEVWLLAAGGVLVFAFPRAYAAAFAGFYLPLMLVLWILIARGMAMEVRSRDTSPLWRSFWDAVLALASVGLAILLGAAFANVIRGVGLAGRWFSTPLFTNFLVSRRPGVLDWYTVLVGIFTAIALAVHGGLFLACKTAEPVASRSREAAVRLLPWQALLAVLVTAATIRVQPVLFGAMLRRPLAWPLEFIAIAAPAYAYAQARRRHDLWAFLASCAFLACMLAAGCAGLYPHLLISRVSPVWDINAGAAAAGSISLLSGLWWWPASFVLVTIYFANLFRQFRGRVATSDDSGHY